MRIERVTVGSTIIGRIVPEPGDVLTPPERAALPESVYDRSRSLEDRRREAQRFSEQQQRRQRRVLEQLQAARRQGRRIPVVTYKEPQ